jgi:hypothetical protein
MISSSGDQSGAGAKISDLLAPENKNSQFSRNRSFVVTWKRGKANKEGRSALAEFDPDLRNYLQKREKRVVSSLLQMFKLPSTTQ